MVRIRALSVVAVIALFSVAAVLSNALQAPPSTAKRSAGGFHFKPSPKVRAILDKVDSRRIAQYDQALVGFRNRNTLSAQNDPEQGIGAARDYIFNKFQDFAERSDGRMSVRLQSYIQPKVPELLPRDVRITHVVATLRGTQPASIGRTYVVSGHYDSRCSDVFDTKCLAPGADDDASGVSAVLEMARVMAGHEFDATIIFMAVAGEEQGLFGSTRFVDVAKRNDLDVGGMITNDIVGASNGADPHTVRVFSEGVPSDETADEAAIRESVGGENDSPARQLARFVKEVGENSTTDMRVDLIFRRDRYLRGGDQIPFLEGGYRSAVRFTEPRENFNHQHQDVRKEDGVQFGDLLRFVDFDYVARVTKVNVATLGALADAPAAPADAKIIAVELTNDTTLTWQGNKEEDLAGYEIVWRKTTAPEWEHSVRIGKVTRHTLPLSKDNFFFGVRAVDVHGNRSPVSFPVPEF